MNNADKAYNDLCRDILETGVAKADRTGTGTLSVFGRQLRFDLSEGFPLLTGKRVPFRLILEELLFFVGGKTNLKDLLEKDVDIWTRDGYAKHLREGGAPSSLDAFRDDVEAMKEGFDLGPIYGSQWTAWGRSSKLSQPTPQLREGLDATYLGVGNGKGKEHHPLGKTWEGMMMRCYSTEHTGYQGYGAQGAHVSDEWLEFAKFAEDAVKLPGYELKLSSDTRYVLDKDGIGNGSVYSAETCQWITDAENGNLKSKRTYVLERNGIEYKFRNPTSFAKEQGISDKNLSDLWTGAKNAKVRYGFRLVEVIEDDVPSEGINQLRQAIEEIQNNPDSRRMIVSAWNPAELDDMALPPCHIMFQLYVADGKLSLQMYQRSADVFLGLPFNIASYALLLEMIAQVTGYDVGELIISIGDCHIYTNHITQVETQIAREPRELPKLSLILPRGGDIDSYDYDCFYLSGYEPHGRLRGEQSF